MFISFINADYVTSEASVNERNEVKWSQTSSGNCVLQLAIAPDSHTKTDRLHIARARIDIKANQDGTFSRKTANNRMAFPVIYVTNKSAVLAELSKVTDTQDSIEWTEDNQTKTNRKDFQRQVRKDGERLVMDISIIQHKYNKRYEYTVDFAAFVTAYKSMAEYRDVVKMEQAVDSASGEKTANTKSVVPDRII